MGEQNSWVDGKFRALLLALAPQGRFDVRFSRFEVTWLRPIQCFLLERKLRDSFLHFIPGFKAILARVDSNTFFFSVHYPGVCGISPPEM